MYCTINDKIFWSVDWSESFRWNFFNQWMNSWLFLLFFLISWWGNIIFRSHPIETHLSVWMNMKKMPLVNQILTWSFVFSWFTLGHRWFRFGLLVSIEIGGCCLKFIFTGRGKIIIHIFLVFWCTDNGLSRCHHSFVDGFLSSGFVLCSSNNLHTLLDHTTDILLKDDGNASLLFLSSSSSFFLSICLSTFSFDLSIDSTWDACHHSLAAFAWGKRERERKWYSRHWMVERNQQVDFHWWKYFSSYHERMIIIIITTEASYSVRSYDGSRKRRITEVSLIVLVSTWSVIWIFSSLDLAQCHSLYSINRSFFFFFKSLGISREKTSVYAC